MADNVELGYAANTDGTVTTSATYVDIPGLSVPVDIGTRPVNVNFSAGAIYSTSANSGVSVAICRGTAIIGACGAGGVMSAFESNDVNRTIRDNPAAGSYTYKAQIKKPTAGTATLFADSGSTFGPASLQVIEV